MDILKHACQSSGNLSQDAMNTFAEIAQSIQHHSTLSQWDRSNEYMREALLKAKSDSSNKRVFIKNAMIETGIMRPKHPLIQWCVENWYK